MCDTECPTFYYLQSITSKGVSNAVDEYILLHNFKKVDKIKSLGLGNDCWQFHQQLYIQFI